MSVAPSAAGRLRRGGLRTRLGVALVATSLATLLAATLALVPPLEGRLERDRVTDLRGLARTARPALRSLRSADLRRGARRLDEIVSRLARRSGGRITILDEQGSVLAISTVNDEPPDPVELARERALARRGAPDAGVRGGEAVVVSEARGSGHELTLVVAKDLGDTRAAASAVRRALPLAAGAGLLVGALQAALLSRGLLRRLRRLRADARKLGEAGLGHAVAVQGADEVAEVAAALEEMRRRLIAEEVARQSFLSTASHELRTPLASLQGTLELLVEQLERPAPDAARAHERAGTALRQTHRLADLATDLLHLSRIDGATVPVVEPIDLRAVVRAVTAEMADELTGSGRRLRVSETGPAVRAVADPLAVAQILRVLFDNARKHGEGTVEVSVASASGTAELIVCDEGPGLAAPDRERVFLRFERGSGAQHPGFGLGLPIARGLARAMGGDVTPRDAGQGACMALTLPRWDPAEVEPLLDRA